MGGFVGVDVFFVISGFVIAKLLIDELEASYDLDLAMFYARRVRRLLPALALLIVFVMLAGASLLAPVGPQLATSHTGTWASLSAGNVELYRSPSGYFDASADTNALLHTWSLSVEEQFYLLFPGFLLLVWRMKIIKNASRARCALATAVLTLASFGLSLAMSHGHGERIGHALGGTVTKFAFYSPFTRIWEFGVGILVALFVERFVRTSRVLADALAIAGLLAILVAAVKITRADVFPGTVALLPVLGTAAAIAGGAHPKSFVRVLLGMRPLVLVGDISYGWYLWHWPFIVFARALWPHSYPAPLMAAVLALVPTAISYRTVESRFRFDTRIVGKRAVALVAACVAASVGACIVLRALNAMERREPCVIQAEAAASLHVDVVKGCSDGPALGKASCVWESPSARGTIVLVGDSNAGQFSEALAKSSLDAGYRFVVATRNGCPFADVDAVRGKHSTAACRDFVKNTLTSLLEMQPALVVIASSSSFYVTNPATLFRDDLGHTAATPGDKAALWENGIRSVVKPLSARGIPTLIVHAIPGMSGMSLLTCPYLKLWLSPESCGATVNRQQTEAAQSLARDAERRAIDSVPGAHAVELFDDLCDATSCSARRGTTWMYRDQGHISVPASKGLAPRFRKLIEDYARR